MSFEWREGELLAFELPFVRFVGQCCDVVTSTEKKGSLVFDVQVSNMNETCPGIF